MTLLFLMAGHFWADFILQSNEMSKGKNRHRPPLGIPPGQAPQTIWPYWLTAHAVIHGTVVYFITGSLEAGIIEAMCHWIIDFGKCENWYGIHFDQTLHAVCKVGIAYGLSL